MHPFHERLARIGLAAGARYDFALAGGYAMQANGMLERPSEDVDLFTTLDWQHDFEQAVAAIRSGLVDDGLDVTVDEKRLWKTFRCLYVTDPRSGETSKLELAADFRVNRPVWLAIGPVLHPDDAVANKVTALWGRAEPRDFVDVNAAIASGRYTHQELLQLAAGVDGGFDPHMFGEALGEIARIPDSTFAQYEVYGRELAELREHFADWRAELLGTAR